MLRCEPGQAARKPLDQAERKHECRQTELKKRNVRAKKKPVSLGGRGPYQQNVMK
jgi:hypothetical protein